MIILKYHDKNRNDDNRNSTSYFPLYGCYVRYAAKATDK